MQGIIRKAKSALPSYVPAITFLTAAAQRLLRRIKSIWKMILARSYEMLSEKVFILVRKLQVTLVWDGVYLHPKGIDKIAGIYMVLAGAKGSNGKWEPSTYKLIDIGQSGGLGGRLVNHDREQCWARNTPAGKVLLFKIAAMPSSDYYDEVDRRIVECCLRAHNQPLPCGTECNDGYKRGDLVKISNKEIYAPLNSHYICP